MFLRKKYKILSQRLDYQESQLGLLAWKFYDFGTFSGKEKFGSFIKFEEKIVFWKKHNVSLFFGFSARKILIMDGKFLVALLELLSTCLANLSKILGS